MLFLLLLVLFVLLILLLLAVVVLMLVLLMFLVLSPLSSFPLYLWFGCCPSAHIVFVIVYVVTIFVVQQPYGVPVGFTLTNTLFEICTTTLGSRIALTTVCPQPSLHARRSCP
jgi:hypothetical protein